MEICNSSGARIRVTVGIMFVCGGGRIYVVSADMRERIVLTNPNPQHGRKDPIDPKKPETLVPYLEALSKMIGLELEELSPQDAMDVLDFPLPGVRAWRFR